MPKADAKAVVQFIRNWRPSEPQNIQEAQSARYGAMMLPQLVPAVESRFGLSAIDDAEDESIDAELAVELIRELSERNTDSLYRAAVKEIIASVKSKP